MKIRTDYPGGSVLVRSVTEGRVLLAADLRNTESDWFYWSFQVCGAQGQTVTFDFSPKPWVGYYGPAVSHDGTRWHFAEGDRDEYRFTYTFGEQEDGVFFCHHIPYLPERFSAFAEETGLPVETLCLSERGHPIPLLRFGQGQEAILLTARHHCCESTGTYVMEGILRQWLKQPPEGFTVLAVPFVDLDGVLSGEQGKGRLPHDHNRDYVEHPLYESVRAVKALGDRYCIRYAWDLHSPWHCGGYNDEGHAVRRHRTRNASLRFEQLLQEETENCPEAFRYRVENGMDEGTFWNTGGESVPTCANYFAKQPGVRLSLTVETPYFGTPENRVSQERLLAYGQCFARAICRYIADDRAE